MLQSREWGNEGGENLRTQLLDRRTTSSEIDRMIIAFVVPLSTH